jgi:hypothetical protein
MIAAALIARPSEARFGFVKLRSVGTFVLPAEQLIAARISAYGEPLASERPTGLLVYHF